LQETKIQSDKEDFYRYHIPNYTGYFSSSIEKKGYSGTAAFILNETAGGPSVKKVYFGMPALHTNSENIEGQQVISTASNPFPPKKEEIKTPEVIEVKKEGEKIKKKRVGNKLFPSKSRYNNQYSNEGRILTIELDNFYVVNTYVPNSGDKLQRLSFRVENWDKDMSAYIDHLQRKKPVIWLGDLNVAHLDVDVWNPTTRGRSPCWTDEERSSFSTMLSKHNFIDSFRHYHPSPEKAFSQWSYRTNGRDQNRGMRLDYVLVDDKLKHLLKDGYIADNIYGSDHCPVAVIIKKE